MINEIITYSPEMVTHLAAARDAAVVSIQALPSSGGGQSTGVDTFDKLLTYGWMILGAFAGLPSIIKGSVSKAAGSAGQELKDKASWIAVGVILFLLVSFIGTWVTTGNSVIHNIFG